jgi:hypothetical protein
MQHPEIFPVLLLLFIIPFVLLIMFLKVLAFWKICSRVGFSGALGLLMLVPFGGIILPLVVAFSKWPAVKQEPKQETPSA